VETVITSQYRPLQRGNPLPSPDRVRVDARWRLDVLHQCEPAGKPHQPREHRFCLPRNTALLFCQLVGVAKGLHYLHFCGVVHGDLKGVGTSLSLNLQVSLIGTL
jgi:hypothetical protein